ncbi:sigma-B regulation protein RsbU (phosphoserine phosphatase) [Fodinibius salinus]|uniref:Sigma-B regulation protein RsbU (Phosphoserine phosphatase) n=1 Tax=Fodinibius salinus TaxID=860790 RepID=A0A5D3YL64_9BACT|nr:SpoIIE family protein phosphatase [Fodinibius salinus]TYP93397.1 sigma-B regulation protein RsbU (phosphoserine phosphatase) [Fodinibius salinus]
MSSNSTQENANSRFELQTLLETSRMLVESQDMDFVLNNLLLITMGKLMVSRGMILIYQPGSDNYKVSKSKGADCMPEGASYSFENAEALKEQSVIHCEHEEFDLRNLIGSGNCTLFNLRTSNNHIGFLCLGAKGDNNRLQEEEVEFIESLAIISSVAIANSRMFTELRRTNRMLDRKVYDLNTLFDLSKDFNIMVDRQEIVRTFKFALLGQMLIRKFFFILDHEGSREMVASSGIAGQLTTAQINQLFDYEKNLIEVDNTLASEIPFLDENDITALIGLHLQDEKVAVVGVGARANGEPYTTSDYNFLRSLGNLAVLSIEKTYLLEERIEKERLEEELNIAKSIQQGLLPDPIPQYDQLDIAARNLSSYQVGGDYFDILETPGGRLLFAIGDVTGKGIPAALLMANLQAMLHVLLPVDLSLSEASGQINDIIFKNTPPDKFITFFWGLYDPKSSEFQFVNAGHTAPIWLKNDGDKVERLDEGGLILGAMPTSNTYSEQTITVSNGDILVFYTDGVTEALNPAQTEEFGEQRLINCIKNNQEKTAADIQQSIINKVLTFSDDIQHDDITLIIIKVH